MHYELTGWVKSVDETKEYGKNGFKKREFVVSTDGQKGTNDIPLQAWQDRCPMLDQLNLGDNVTVSFDIMGREWDGRHFVDLKAWNVVVNAVAPGQAAPASQTADSANAALADAGWEEEDSADIPF